MKFKILSLTFALAAMAALSACDDWKPEGSSQFAPGTGGAYSGTINVDVASEPTKSQSRAGADTDISSFIVFVTAKGSDEVVRYDGETCRWTYSSMPEIITLPVGDYTVHVASHEPEPVAWNAPYFEGQTDFTVVSNKVVNINTVHCSFRSLKIGVNFDEAFLSAMDPDKSSVTVTAGSAGTSAVWSATETRCAYFYLTEDNPTVIVHFNGILNGLSHTAGKTVNSAHMGDYYIFNFSLNQGNPEPPEEFGSTTVPDISIDVDMVRDELNSQLKPGENGSSSEEKHPNTEEWPETEDPGTDPGEPDNPDTPASNITITPDASCADLNLEGKENPIVDGKPYVINIHADKGIENLVVKIKSTNDDFISSAGELLPMSFDMAHLDSEVYDKLESIGLKGNEAVLGKEDVPFDITELVPLLSSFPGTHTFEISVTDKDGKSLSKSLILKAE